MLIVVFSANFAFSLPPPDNMKFKDQTVKAGDAPALTIYVYCPEVQVIQATIAGNHYYFYKKEFARTNLPADPARDEKIAIGAEAVYDNETAVNNPQVSQEVDTRSPGIVVAKTNMTSRANTWNTDESGGFDQLE